MIRHTALASAALARAAAAAALLTAALTTPAAAETDWAKYKSFKGVRCEDKATIADIRESIKGLTFDDGGGATFGLASSIRITRSRTLSATDKVLVCLLGFRTVEAGDTLTYNARHTVWLEPGNNWRTQFMPNY